MKKILLLFILVIFCQVIFGYQNDIKKSDWMSKKVPENKAEIFGKGIISTKAIEFSPAISPDNKVFYYVISNPDYSDYKIVKRNILDSGFGDLTYITKSSIKKEYSPFPISDKLFYVKPETNTGKGDIYYKKKTKNIFFEIVKLKDSVNTSYIEGFVSVSGKGTLCFESDRPGGFGKGDIYLAYPGNTGYKVVNAGKNINSKLNESDTFIAKDESFLIVTVYNKIGGYGQSDLYISVKKNNKYTELINMGSKINSAGLEHNPHISQDGKFFFFSSNKKIPDSKGAGNGNFDIYWISAYIINKFIQK